MLAIKYKKVPLLVLLNHKPITQWLQRIYHLIDDIKNSGMIFLTIPNSHFCVDFTKVKISCVSRTWLAWKPLKGVVCAGANMHGSSWMYQEILLA